MKRLSIQQKSAILHLYSLVRAGRKSSYLQSTLFYKDSLEKKPNLWKSYYLRNPTFAAFVHTITTFPFEKK